MYVYTNNMIYMYIHVYISQKRLCRFWDSVAFNIVVLALIVSNFAFTVEQVYHVCQFYNAGYNVGGGPRPYRLQPRSTVRPGSRY